jgi:hypothetical protein
LTLLFQYHHESRLLNNELQEMLKKFLCPNLFILTMVINGDE